MELGINKSAILRQNKILLLIHLLYIAIHLLSRNDTIIEVK